MKRLLLALCGLALAAADTSLLRADAYCNNPNCRSCVARRQAAAAACPWNNLGSLFSRGARGAGADAGYMNAGMSPTVAYPYYTVRAPRDFLSPNPGAIGP